jgi:hypothetical protein
MTSLEQDFFSKVSLDTESGNLKWINVTLEDLSYLACAEPLNCYKAKTTLELYLCEYTDSVTMLMRTGMDTKYLMMEDDALSVLWDMVIKIEEEQDPFISAMREYLKRK